MNEKLRKEVKLLKALQNVSYKEIAELLEVKQDSIYNWLSGYFDFGEERQERLQDIVSTLKE